MAEKRPFKPYPAGTRYAEEDRLKALGINIPKPQPKPWPVTSDKTDRLTVGTTKAHAADVRKSDNAAEAKIKFNRDKAQIKGKLGSNVLHQYRSSTYNFVLSGLDKSIFAPTEPAPTFNKFQTSSKSLVILSSAGKGDNEIQSTAGASSQAKSYVNSFNKNSPGRFDMFIDNVEIESLFSFEQNSTVTLPSKFRFDVYEPYSINGFVEALHAAAVAGGYANYAEASFLLRMSFAGYSDQSSRDNSTDNISGAERFFVIKITGFQIDITEKGTRYTCTAIPYTDSVMSDVENRLQQTVQIQGVTIETILTNFGKTLTQQRKESEAKARKPAPENFDEYKIEFAPPLDGAESELKYFKESPFSTFGQESQIFVFTDPQQAAGKNGYSRTNKDTLRIVDEAGRTVDRYGNVLPTGQPEPTGSVVNFAANTNITDCISAVIVGSNWHRSLLDKLPERIDSFGMVNYFSIRMEVQNKPGKLDTVKNRPYQIFKYIISPYKIHFSKVPNYESQKIDPSQIDLTKLSYRNYEYTYTGNNVDVINFKIHFDNLYYEAVSRAMGNSDALGAKDAPAQSGTISLKSKETEKKQDAEESDPIPVPPKYQVALLNKDPTASQPLWSDPYYIMSKNMYESIVNSASGMIRGEIEILGDPFFLVMGGQGNYKPETAGYGITTNGSVDLYNGQVFIQITFRNPDDIGSFKEGGLAKFDKNKVSFSGIYMVTKVVSKFSNGVFKQKLNILRMLQSTKYNTTPSELTVTEPNEINSRDVRDGKPSDVTPVGTP
jgi:hypothetical protein